jgi:hypothetical protein
VVSWRVESGGWACPAVAVASNLNVSFNSGASPPSRLNLSEAHPILFF